MNAKILVGLGLWAGAVCAGSCAGQEAQSARDYWLYVTAESADEIYKVRFDGERAEIAKVIPVGALPTEIEGPHGLTVGLDGEHWYLTMAHGKPYGVLYKFATATDELVAQTELGLFPATMQISRSTGLLYCVNFDLHGKMKPSSVSIVDPDAMVEVARTTTGPMPHGSRLSPDGTRHYSCAMMTGQLFEIDAVDFTVKRVLDLDDAPDHAHHDHGRPLARDEHEAHDGGAEAPASKPTASRPSMPKASHSKASKPTWVHPHPTLPRVYVALNGADEVAEVDLEKWAIVRRFPTDKGPYNVEVTPDGKKLLVSYKSAGAVGIWDLASGEELARIASSRRVTHGVVISKDGRYGFVSCEGIGGEKGTLDVFDMRSNEKVSTLELGLQAGGIAFWKSVAR